MCDPRPSSCRSSLPFVHSAKTETSSYTNIRQTIGVEPEEIVFVTDMLGEATAAEAAGLQVVLSKRPGNKPLDPTSIPVVESFSPLV